MVWAVVSVVGLALECSVIVALGLSATGSDGGDADVGAADAGVPRPRRPALSWSGPDPAPSPR